MSDRERMQTRSFPVPGQILANGSVEMNGNFLKITGAQGIITVVVDQNEPDLMIQDDWVRFDHAFQSISFASTVPNETITVSYGFGRKGNSRGGSPINAVLAGMQFTPFVGNPSIVPFETYDQEALVVGNILTAGTFRLENGIPITLDFLTLGGSSALRPSWGTLTFSLYSFGANGVLNKITLQGQNNGGIASLFPLTDLRDVNNNTMASIDGPMAGGTPSAIGCFRVNVTGLVQVVFNGGNNTPTDLLVAWSLSPNGTYQ